MTYLAGFVAAVPTERKQDYLHHAQQAATVLKEAGVERLVENWGDDIPYGKLTDFRRAVQAQPDETVVFSWFEFADRAARDAATQAMMADPRMEAMGQSMPFDGKRMIYGGFQVLIDEGNGGKAGYTDGMITPVPEANKADYLALARKTTTKFLALGAVRVVEAWGDDVPEGKRTDYRHAVQAEAGETVVYSFIQWSDKRIRDEAWQKLMNDPDMQENAMPFDGRRMFWGGFVPMLDV